MSENDLDNLLESIDLEDAINVLEFSPGEDIKPLEKEDTKPEPTVTAQVGGATFCRAKSVRQHRDFVCCIV